MIEHPCFSGRPTLGKIAKNGDWECAKVFEPGECTSQEDVAVYLGESTEIACEAFFGAAFFGCRRKGVPEELRRFVGTFAAIVASAPSGNELFRLMVSRLGIPVAQRFCFAEIGAVDAWKSVGPMQLVDPRAELRAFEALIKRLSNASVGLDRNHRKALEFAYDNGDGTTHWIALPISDGPQIDTARLKEALESFTMVPA